MGDRAVRARMLARAADLFIVRVAERGARVNRGVLELGPDWSPDEVATLACRRTLGPNATERDVREMVRTSGFAYVAPAEPRSLTA